MVFCFMSLGVGLASSPSFGVALHPLTAGWPALNAHVRLPVAGYAGAGVPIVFSGRLDVSTLLDFSTPPSVGLSGLIGFQTTDMFEPYVGVGAALGWRGAGWFSSAFVTPTVLGGVSARIDDVWSAHVEAIVAPWLRSVSFGIGVEVTPW